MKGKKCTEETKKKMSEVHKGKPHSEEWNKKVGLAHKGKKHSAEWVKHSSEAKKGKKLSEEQKKAISEAQLGSTYWNNGIICKRFKKGEESKNGWVRGKLGHAWNYKGNK